MKHLDPNQIDLLALFAGYDPLHVFAVLTGVLLAVAFVAKGTAAK